MADKLKITFVSLPDVDDHITLSFYPTGSLSPFVRGNIFKSTRVNPGEVTIGADVDALAVNYAAAFVLDYGSNFTVLIDGSVVTIEANNGSPLFDYGITGDTVFATFELVVPTPVEGNMFQILVIDTYENDRELIDELTHVNSPKLRWEGGDDVFQAIIASELNFNMLVPDAADAKFAHLFTGDEKRYKVQFNNIDEDENVTLIWQGYLLPDIYKEPYHNGVFFVDFTAVDMLGSLKGKFFDPWVYYQKFTNPELLAMILAFTGLEQQMVVKPSLVNSANEPWETKIIPLEPYIKDGKPVDVYNILQDLLESQALSILSFGGLWIVEGFTRKGETAGECFQYDAAGVRTVIEPLTYIKYLTPTVPELGSIFLGSVTPFKSVDVDFQVDSAKNLYPDDVVVRETKFVGYLDDDFIKTTPFTTSFKQWIKVGASFLKFINPDFQFAFARQTPIADGDFYNGTEAAATVNYFKCPETPYVDPGLTYELELEVEAILTTVLPLNQAAIQDFVNGGHLDSLVSWELITDYGDQLRSNMPSAPTRNSNKWDSKQVVELSGIYDHTILFKMKREFGVADPAFLTFRYHAPIANFSPGFKDFVIIPKVHKINVLDGSSNESVRAIRDINFTQVKNITLPITCSVNTAVPNGISQGERIGEKELEITVGTQSDVLLNQTFPPLNDLDMILKKFDITDDIMRRIFLDGKAKSVFLTKVDGRKYHFYSLYGKKFYITGSTLVMTPQLYYLTDYEGRPFIPKDYKRLPEIEAGDVLKILLSDFSEEVVSGRELWHVHGYPDWEMSYPKTLANAYHVVRPYSGLNLEATVLDLIFPNQLLQFTYDESDLVFVPTRLELDLVSGKTRVNSKVYNVSQPEDISYE